MDPAIVDLDVAEDDGQRGEDVSNEEVTVGQGEEEELRETQCRLEVGEVQDSEVELKETKDNEGEAEGIDEEGEPELGKGKVEKVVQGEVEEEQSTEKEGKEEQVTEHSVAEGKEGEEESTEDFEGAAGEGNMVSEVQDAPPLNDTLGVLSDEAVHNLSQNLEKDASEAVNLSAQAGAEKVDPEMAKAGEDIDETLEHDQMNAFEDDDNDFIELDGDSSEDELLDEDGYDSDDNNVDSPADSYGEEDEEEEIVVVREVSDASEINDNLPYEADFSSQRIYDDDENNNDVDIESVMELQRLSERYNDIPDSLKFRVGRMTVEELSANEKDYINQGKTFHARKARRHRLRRWQEEMSAMGLTDVVKSMEASFSAISERQVKFYTKWTK